MSRKNAPFEQQPSAIRYGHRNGRACNWWENAEADFDRMQQLGLNTHRLSLEEINKGFDLMHAGESIRAVVVY